MALLRHLALRCRDVEISRRFYETIGFKFVDYRPSGVAMDLSDGTINITLLPHGDKERPRLEEGEEYIHFGIYVEDFEAVWQRLHEWGALMEKTVKGRNAIDQDQLPELAFKVMDPDGNVVDITGDKEEWRGALIQSIYRKGMQL